MSQTINEINSKTTISEAIEILKQRADAIAGSAEAAAFLQQNAGFSKLFVKPYPPYQRAVQEYEQALELNEWLNGKNPANGHLTILETFKRMTDQQRLSLFMKRINTDTPGLFDECLMIWWKNRY